LGALQKKAGAFLLGESNFSDIKTSQKMFILAKFYGLQEHKNSQSSE
jgi:hypothetical protein